MVSLAAALLLAAPADDAGTHLGIVAGAGGAENLLGAHLQLRHDHLAVFLGTGLPMLTGSWSDGYHYAAVIGGRWYSGLGDRVFVSAQFNFLAWQQLIVHDELGGREILTPFQGYAFTIVGGWRWRYHGFVFDLGIGGGVLSQSDGESGPIPDLTAAVGYEF
jgi:hypothetical protein